MIFQVLTFVLSLPTLVSSVSMKIDLLPVANVRTDPIISNVCLTDHVNVFYGPQAVRPETTNADLTAMSPWSSSGNVMEDLSLYWHPAIYAFSPNTKTYTRQEIFYSSAYYIWPNQKGQGEKVMAFPRGFRMIAGYPLPGAKPEVEFTCDRESPCNRADGGCSINNTKFPNTACGELEVSMNFPLCWDGRLDSPDHMSHIAYTQDGAMDSNCPASHSAGRFPQLSLFFRIANYTGGAHQFADGSETFHAGFMSGWDPTFLQSVLNRCDNDSVTAQPNEFCDRYMTFKDAPKDPGFNNSQIRAQLETLQPVPLNTRATIAPEEVDVVQHLPRTVCNGTLLPNGTFTNETSPGTAPPSQLPTTVSPTVYSPTTASPSASSPSTATPSLRPSTAMPSLGPPTDQVTASPSAPPITVPIPCNDTMMVKMMYQPVSCFDTPTKAGYSCLQDAAPPVEPVEITCSAYGTVYVNSTMLSPSAKLFLYDPNGLHDHIGCRIALGGYVFQEIEFMLTNAFVDDQYGSFRIECC